MSSSRLKKMIGIALIGLISYLLARFTKFVVFPAAPFLKLDFGEVPLLLASCIFGWQFSLCALTIKELLSLFVSGSNIFGLVADFIVCGVFLVFVSLYIADYCKFTRITVATLFGAAARLVICIPVNLVILKLQFGTDAVGVWEQMVYILPFNLLKCIIGGICLSYLLPRLRKPLSSYMKSS